MHGVHLVNPYAGACKLDDKAWSGRCWQQAGLPTPSFRVVPRGSSVEEAAQALGEFAGRRPRIVLKPADGTEGRGVAFVQPESAQARTVLSALVQTGAALIMPEHGRLRYYADTAARRCTLRLNVCWDGHEAHAESGYAQVASTRDAVASAGCGGRLLPLREVWAHLSLPDGTPFVPTADDWRRLLATAEAGVRALAAALSAAMPALLGIDLLLDLDAEGRLLPLLLEANPRPAGLGHAQLLNSGGPTNEPGVTLRLWRTLR